MGESKKSSDNEERQKERDRKREEGSQRCFEERICQMKEMEEEGSKAGRQSCDEQRKKNKFVSENHSPL